jgi:hypothetical protein
MSGPAEHPIANDFFMLARDERAGAPFLSESIEATALAAALLGELLIDDLVVVHRGEVYSRPDGLAKLPQAYQMWLWQDHAIQTAMQIIQGQRRPPPVTALIEFLSSKVHQLIINRLVVAGDIEINRGLRGVRYVPTSQFVWSRPRIRLMGAITYDGYYATMQPTERVRLLAGLVLTTGLVSRVTVLAPQTDVGKGLSRLADELPEDLQGVTLSVAQAMRRLAVRR